MQHSGLSPRLVRRVLVFLYARISEDPNNQRQGVERQLEDLRVYAVEELHGEVAGEWIDNDISAMSGEERPAYDECVAAAFTAAKDPAIHAIVAAYHPSRLWRRRVERAQAIDDFWEAKADAAFESAGHFNLQKATQRSQLAQVGESDTAESEVKGERVARAALQRAQAGRVDSLDYGWQRIYEHDDQGKVIGFHDVLHPDQAPVVEEIVKSLLSGVSDSALELRLNTRGEPSPGAGRKRKKRALGQDDTGSKWNKTSVKKIALRPINAGILVYKGIEYKAARPPIITEEQHAQIKLLYAERAKTSGPELVAVGALPGQRKHLLSWSDFATCGVCGTHLSVKPRGSRKRGTLKPTYVCNSFEACIGRNEAALDWYVTEAAVDLLTDPGAADVFRGDDSAALAELERAEGLKARQDATADDYAAGRITRDQLLRITSSLAQQITEAQQEARRLRPAVDLKAFDGLVGPKAAARWEALEVSQRWRVLRALGLELKVMPTQRRGPGFDDSAIKMRWGVREENEPTTRTICVPAPLPGPCG